MLTVCEVGEVLGLCDRTVRRMIKAGRLREHRVAGRQVRVSEEDLRAYIASQRV
jgi:excisionase family DNA binding protein